MEEAAFFYHIRLEHLQGDESVIGQDQRVLVGQKDYGPGGKYRSLYSHEGQRSGDPRMMATGWLIRNDLVVTAGHVACDWDHKLGFVKEIKCYLEYYGRAHVKDDSVERRHGATVSVPAEWIKGPNEIHDVAFIKLDRPFDDVQSIHYTNTPAKGTLNLDVVGYPGDLSLLGEHHKGEHVYKMFQQTAFELAQHNKLLTYNIDTFGGNSGSPVLMKQDKRAIGVHVLGGTTNAASVIGPLGNSFHSYITSFTRKHYLMHSTIAKDTAAKNFRIVSVRAFDLPSQTTSPSLGVDTTDNAANGIGGNGDVAPPSATSSNSNLPTGLDLANGNASGTSDQGADDVKNATDQDGGDTSNAADTGEAAFDGTGVDDAGDGADTAVDESFGSVIGSIGYLGNLR